LKGVDMRMAELSRLSKVPVPTIKYYLRERLLAAGTLTAVNQAEYGPGHLRRLRLIRGLVEVAGLSIAAVKRVLLSIDSTRGGLRIAGAACDLASGRAGGKPGDPAEIASLASELGWRGLADSPAMAHAAEIIATLRSIDPSWDGTHLAAYASAASAVAGLTGVPQAGADRAQTGHAGTDQAGADQAETLVARVMLGEALLAVLHRLALLASVPVSR
jgi:hypothetical protein